MTRRAAPGLIAVIVLANGAATVLYCGVGPTDATPLSGRAVWNPVLQGIAHALTLPVPTAGITDVRDVALIASLGLALLIAALAHTAGADASPSRGAGASKTEHPAAHRAEDATALRNPASAWIAWSALGVMALSLWSALTNESLGLSWGWMVRFAAGAIWASLIARMSAPAMTRQTLFALLVLAACCVALTIADRADRGLAHFRWPIGPITITAALAAVWAAAAGGWAAGLAFCRRSALRALMLGVIGVAAAYVLQQTGRRAPALGLIAAGLVVAALLLWSRYRSRILNGCIIGLFLAAGACASLYVVTQLRSPAREVSGPLALRLAYWTLSAGLIAENPCLGSGPDTFVIQATNAIAPLRAESPHVYHGRITQYAHNEWIQTAVELGIPAALACLGLPLGVLFFAVRRLPRSSAGRKPGRNHAADHDDATRVLCIALIGGLVCVLVTECASITLRVPMMPVWYWTLLGLLASLCTTRPRRRPAARRRRLPPSLAPLVLVILAVACFAVTAADTTRAVAEARKDRSPDGRFGSRLYADKTIAARFEAAVLASREAHAQPRPLQIETALSLWQNLYETIPARHNVPARYADVLILAGQSEAARTVLEDALGDRLDPFNVAANTLYAGLLPDDPVARFRCVQRALRSGGLDPSLQEILIEACRRPAVVGLLNRELPEARLWAADDVDQPAAGATIELLRANAFLEESSGRPGAAISDQRLAARFYRRLERRQNPYRRPDAAETDAFFTLARMLYEADPANYQEAFDAIVEAERYAVLGIRHERVADPRPEEGFVGGVVLPMELPQRLYPMWRLSALLHLVAGRLDYILVRVLSGLPPTTWTTAEPNRQLARLARQAYEDLGRLPPADRPGHYDSLLEMARPYERTSQDAIDDAARQVQPP